MDRRACLELVDLCYRSVENAGLWQVFVERLTRTLDADACDFVMEDHVRGAAEPLGSVGFDPAFRLSYDEAFIGENPWINRLKTLPKQRAFSNDLEPEDFERSPYYNEWVRPQGFRHALGGFVEQTPSRVMHLGVLRDRRRTRFGSEEGQLLDRLFPHVRRALIFSDRLQAARNGNASLIGLVEQLRVAAFLVDAAGRLLHHNGRAEDLLRQGRELRLVKGRLTPWLTQTGNALEEALGRTGQVEDLSPDRVEIVLPKQEVSAPPLVLDVIPLFESGKHGSTGARCLILVTDPSEARPVSEDLLQRMWRLTPTEAKLAIGLAGGCTTREFAERSGMSIGTARWHLKNLQSKTGANSIARLVLLVNGASLRS